MTVRPCSSNPDGLGLTVTLVSETHAGCRIRSKITSPEANNSLPKGSPPAPPVHDGSGSPGFVQFGSSLSPASFSDLPSLNTQVLSSHLLATVRGGALASSQPANPGRCCEMSSEALSHGNLVLILDSPHVLSSEDLRDMDKH